MKWVKLGRVLCVSGEHGWMNSHAQVPSVLVLEDRLRVYFASRPEPGKSLTGFVDVAIDEPTKILYLHDKPILEVGAAGSFDEHGIMPNHVFFHEGKVYLFYVGWSRRQSIPYSNWMGMAISEDDGRTFRKAFRGPILDRTRDEIYSATGLFCIRHAGEWHGWYAAGTQWLQQRGGYEHTYDIRYCRSDNLIDWHRFREPILTPRIPNESNTRPSVIFLDGRWHMWFCFRGIEDFRDGKDSYRIGYAWSTDLNNWTREDDRSGVELSEDGWDSKMIAYPYIIMAQDRTFMFYNGNGFGRTGIGCAVLEKN